jgi:hypothetical protein
MSTDLSWLTWEILPRLWWLWSAISLAAACAATDKSDTEKGRTT